MKVLDVIIAILQWINRNSDDYEIRELAGELTPAEYREQDRAEMDNHEKHMQTIMFWHG